MPTYDEIITREKADTLIPQPIANEIMKEVPRNSAVLSLARKRNMGTKTDKLPVISAMPNASFGNGDSFVTGTSAAEWKNKVLTAETVSTLIIVPEDLADDTSIDLFDEIAPMAAEAIGIALDKAVLFGVGKPDSWPDGLVPQAIAAGNKVVRGTTPQNKGGVFTDLINLRFLVQNMGYRINGIAADDMFEQALLSATDTNGKALVDWNQEQTKLMGKPLNFSGGGVWPGTLDSTEAILGDWTKVVVGIRKDIQMKILNEATINDEEGRVVFNLATQRMKGILITARFGYALANNATRKRQGDAARCPFGVLYSPAA